MDDTHPKIAALVRERLMERSGGERVVMASRMFDAARAMAMAAMPPGLTPREQKAWLARRIYADEPELIERFIAQLP